MIRTCRQICFRGAKDPLQPWPVPDPWPPRHAGGGAGQDRGQDPILSNIFRTLEAAGEPLILISHNMRQVFDLVDRSVVVRRGRIVATRAKEDTDGQDVVAYITGAKTGAAFQGTA